MPLSMTKGGELDAREIAGSESSECLIIISQCCSNHELLLLLQLYDLALDAVLDYHSLNGNGSVLSNSMDWKAMKYESRRSGSAYCATRQLPRCPEIHRRTSVHGLQLSTGVPPGLPETKA